MHPLHFAALLVLFTVPSWLAPLIPTILPLVAGLISSKTFEPFQRAWTWLNTTHPLVRFVASGVWGGLVSYLATVGITLPAAPSAITTAGWTAFIGALATWGWHAFTKATTKATTPAASVTSTPPRAL